MTEDEDPYTTIRRRSTSQMRQTAQPNRRAALEREAERHRQKLERAEARLQALRDVPEIDPFDDGQVIGFDAVFNRATPVRYSYVAIRTNGQWYFSGRQPTGSLAWPAMVEWWLDHDVDKIRIYQVETTRLLADLPKTPPSRTVELLIAHCHTGMYHPPHAWFDASGRWYWCDFVDTDSAEDQIRKALVTHCPRLITPHDNHAWTAGLLGEAAVSADAVFWCTGIPM